MEDLHVQDLVACGVGKVLEEGVVGGVFGDSAVVEEDPEEAVAVQICVGDCS